MEWARLTGIPQLLQILASFGRATLQFVQNMCHLKLLLELFESS